MQKRPGIFQDVFRPLGVLLIPRYAVVDIIGSLVCTKYGLASLHFGSTACSKEVRRAPKPPLQQTVPMQIKKGDPKMTVELQGAIENVQDEIGDRSADNLAKW